jgi:hypothetical protein
MEPYNPNKSFIQFRLNPDAIKEELISFVPYNRTLRHIYNNPEGDIRETAEVAASETPILGSILAGEPTDAVKEAVLMGIPFKTGPNGKRMVDATELRDAVNAKPRRKYYNIDNSEVAYKSGNKYRTALGGWDVDPLNPPKPYNNLNEVLKDINESEYLSNKYLPINEAYYDISNKQTGLNSYNEFIRNNKVKPNEEVFYSDISSGNNGFYEINVLDKNTGKVKSYHYNGMTKKYEPINYNGKVEVYDVNDLVPGAKRKPVQQSDIDLMNKKLQEDINLFNKDIDDYPDYSPIHKDAIWDWLYQQEEGR